MMAPRGGIRMTTPSEPQEQRAGSDDWILARLPDHIHARLTPDLIRAIAEAAAPRAWAGHPVDIRLSIPLPFGRYYLALVAGPERRPDERRIAEQGARRVMTAGNMLFVLSIVVVFYAVLGLAALLLTRIIE
jgi:hypothetical protein